MERRPCTQCGKPRDSPQKSGAGGLNAWCKACKAKWVRENRPRHSDLSDEQRKRATCRAYTNVLIRRGVLFREPCDQCGAEPAEAHHDDYDDPRTVRWLCPPCHRAHHEAA